MRDGKNITERKLIAARRDVAATFGKRHDDVLKAIRDLNCPTNFTERNFAPSEFQDSTGRTLPCFEMTRDGFTRLVMSFTGVRGCGAVGEVRCSYVFTLSRQFANDNSCSGRYVSIR